MTRTGPALVALLALLLAACAPQPSATPPPPDGAEWLSGAALPAFHPPRPAPLPSARPNAQLAQDFLDLEFRLETGRRLPVLTRFEIPLTLSLSGSVPASARHDLADLLRRLRREAHLDLTLLPDDQPAVLTAVFLPKATIRRIDAKAACFVIPNVSSLDDYQRLRGTAALDWARMTTRSRAALFLPADASPQDLRDCLNEELAQAIGPLNDLYRLPDSVFNDDNMISTLTGFDMLMLRLHQSPELHSGMTEAEVAARLPALLARLNPKGEGGAGWQDASLPLSFSRDADLATGSAPLPQRRAAVLRMLALAQDRGWQDNRLAWALYLAGRLSPPAPAHAAFAKDAAIYQTLPDGGAHLAHALMQMAAASLALHQPGQAEAEARRALPLARRAGNAALTATLQLILAEALEAQGQPARAAALRLDSLPAAGYGFGAMPEIRALAAAIAALSRLSAGR